MLHGSLVVLSLLVRLAALTGRRLLHDARLCLNDARVADVELLVGSVTLHFRDKEPLVDVLVAKVSACCFVDVLFIVVIEVDSFVVYEVLRRFVLRLGCRVVLRLCGPSGVGIAVVDEFDLDLVHGTTGRMSILVETLILRLIVQAASLLEIVIMLTFWLIDSFLVLLSLIRPASLQR